jgi:hypothetical protein
LEAVRREDRSRSWEEPDPPSSRAPTSSASTSPRRRLLPSHRRAVPPIFTDACTTARGHQGENKLSCPLWTPRPSSRGERDARTAPPRRSHRATVPLPLVMSAFEPGWEAFSCRCHCQLHRARVVALFCFLVPWTAMSCVAAPDHRRGPAPARSRSCTCPCRLAALAQSCTPARARPSRRGPSRTFGSFSLAPDLTTMLRPCLPRRHGLAMEDCLAHAAAGEWSALLGLSRARLTADPCAHPHASVPGRGFHVCCHPFCIGPSSAASYATPPLCGQLQAQARAARTSTPVHTQAHARARAFAPNTGARPHCRVPPPCRPWRRPRRADRLLPCSSPSSPSDPRGSREALHGA